MRAGLLLVLLSVVFAACQKGAPAGSETVVKSTKDGDMTVTLASSTGEVESGETELFVSFTDASGNPVDVAAASLNFHMAGMGPMPEMNDRAQLTTTETPGKYRARVHIEMAGTWEAQIAYQTAQDDGKATMNVSVK